MQIEKLSLGSMGTNCYVLWGEDKKGVIIDPGFIDSRVEQLVADKQLQIEYIILTHGHFDHIGGVEQLRKITGAKVLISQPDSDCLVNAQRNLSYLAGMNMEGQPADGDLKDGQILAIGQELKLKVISTPGHSKGGISLLTGNHLFSGDALFRASIGRTDFADGDLNELLEGIQTKLLLLPDDTIVYPGHGDNSTIGYEKVNNPFLQGRY